MNSAVYETITDILGELRQEHSDVQKRIDEYQVKIKEIDCYINSYVSSGDEDFKMFSPRGAEESHKRELQEANSGKDNLQVELNKCYHEQNLLRPKIERLEKLLHENKDYSIKSRSKKQNLTMLSIQEEDRQRIARDLHDTALQSLTHLIHKVELSSMYIDQNPIRAKLELRGVSQGIKGVIEEIRNTIFDLRPMTFDDLGLKTSLEEFVQVINEEKKYTLTMDIDDIVCENNMLLATIYRIIQECLINIRKHAKADKINFACKKRNQICMIDIIDNGEGFSIQEVVEKQDNHFGLTVMKERVDLVGGVVSIDSARGRGTHIHIEIPLEQN